LQVGDTGPVESARRSNSRVLGSPFSGLSGHLFSYGLCSVENKAYSRHTWTNDKRHTWTKWKYGHSSLSVDGKENTNLPNCAILDNYDVDKVIYNTTGTPR
jgi:hypothetical protein